MANQRQIINLLLISVFPNVYAGDKFANDNGKADICSRA